MRCGQTVSILGTGSSDTTPLTFSVMFPSFGSLASLPFPHPFLASHRCVIYCLDSSSALVLLSLGPVENDDREVIAAHYAPR